MVCCPICSKTFVAHASIACVAHTSIALVAHASTACVAHALIACVAHASIACVAHASIACVAHASIACVAHASIACVAHASNREFFLHKFTTARARALSLAKTLYTINIFTCFWQTPSSSSSCGKHVHTW